MPRNRTRNIFNSSKGAIDLASIMVGILVIGLIAGVIAAMIFAVIPWSQDKAAKEQLGAVVAAQSANAGFTSSAGKDAGFRFTNKQGLANNPYGANGATGTPTKLLQAPDSMCIDVSTPNGQVIDGGNGIKFGTTWTAAIRSASGKAFYITSENSRPQELTSANASVTCAVPAASTTPGGSTNPAPVDTTAPWNIEDTSLRNTIASRLDVSDPTKLTLGDAARFNDALVGSNPITLANLTTAAGLEKATGFTKITNMYVGPNQDTRGLDNIRQVGTLMFLGSQSTTINGNTMFPNLTTVGMLSIQGASNLTSVTGFDNLTSVTNQVQLLNNSKLISFTGFSKMTDMSSGIIFVSNNNALTTFTAFSNVTNVNNLQVTQNGLTNIDGVTPKLTTANNYLVAGPALTRVTGSSALKNVKNLNISAPNASRIEGYDNVTNVTEGFSVDARQASIAGFKNLNTVNGDMLAIYAKRITGTWNNLSNVNGFLEVIVGAEMTEDGLAGGDSYYTVEEVKASPSSAN
jgi:hypothetical protein